MDASVYVRCMMPSPIQTVESRKGADIAELQGRARATEGVGRETVLKHTVDKNATRGGAVIGDELSRHQPAHACDE